MALSDLTAVVTGASSGIGEAVARGLAKERVRLVLGARRTERIDRLAAELRRLGIEVVGMPLDVTSLESCEAFVAEARKRFGSIDILVNNAGLARGRRNIADGDETEWDEMIDTNVKGLLRMTRLIVPAMIARDSGHIVNIGSVAALGVYEGGSVYCASKWSVRAITQALRLELSGSRIRVTEIDPGLVETEFSLVRFHVEDDADEARSKASAVYEGLEPLRGEDISDCVVWALTRPPHVDIDEIVIRPVAQAGMSKVSRRNPSAKK